MERGGGYGARHRCRQLVKNGCAVAQRHVQEAEFHHAAWEIQVYRFCSQAVVVFVDLLWMLLSSLLCFVSCLMGMGQLAAVGLS